jgi:large subunit ribosomal protein L25
MKTLEINVKKRDSLGNKSTRKLRSEGNVPCVMYGGEEVIHFYAPENSFKDLVYTHHVHMVIFNIDGKTYKAIIKEIQFHPVTDKILHIDFIETADNKPAIVDIPVELTGNSVGIRNGGKLRQRRRMLKVKGLLNDMPDVLEIDITDLNIGESFKVRDIQYDNLEMLDPAQAMVVGVVSSRIAAKGMITVEEVAEEEKAEAEAEAGAEEEAEADTEASKKPEASKKAEAESK